MEKKEFREQVLKLQNEVIKTGFKWENIFRAQVLKEYNFKKWNGKILTRVTYDLKKNQKELFNKKQLKLW